MSKGKETWKKIKEKHFSCLCLEKGWKEKRKKEDLFCLICKGKINGKKYIYIYMYITYIPLERKEMNLR